MRAVDIIRAKRDGEVLEPAVIHAFVRGVLDGTWADYQTSALLMAIVLRGMTAEETAALTEAMLSTGRRIDRRAGRDDIVDPSMHAQLALGSDRTEVVGGEPPHARDVGVGPEEGGAQVRPAEIAVRDDRSPEVHAALLIDARADVGKGSAVIDATAGALAHAIGRDQVDA